MNRIPTEGLKLYRLNMLFQLLWRLNEQNPDRGIETNLAQGCKEDCQSLNEQNPDRGIETRSEAQSAQSTAGLNEQNPDRGIETAPTVIRTAEFAGA